MLSDEVVRGNSFEAATEEIALRSAECARDAFGGRLVSIVLSGSMARCESTFIDKPGVLHSLSDADFFLVFNKRAPKPAAAELVAAARQAESALLKAGIRCPVSFGAIDSDYLRNIAPRIESYELRTRGRVVWGNGDVLTLIPPFSAVDIPLEDGWRLLSNRIVETLQALVGCQVSSGGSAETLRYAVAKLYLDMATSCLLFAGRFRTGYRERCEALQAWAREPADQAATPFPLSAFARRVEECTVYKLGGRTNLAAAASSADEIFCQAASGDARLLWRWELGKLLRLEGEFSDDDLMDQWMARQTLTEKLRGWGSLARRLGVRESWRSSLGWARRARRGTPRYWIYRSGSRLFFELADRAESFETTWNSDYAPRFAACWVPGSGIRRRQDAPPPTWSELATKVVSAYNRLAIDTSA